MKKLIYIIFFLIGIVTSYNFGKESVFNQLETYGHYESNSKYILCAVKENRDNLIYQLRPINP